MTTNETKESLINRMPHWTNRNSNSVLNKWMCAVADELDAFSVEKDNLQKAIQIDTAIGDELDDIGALFKLNRNGGESDTLYRARIKSARSSFIGGGTEASLIQAFVNATGLPSDRITIVEIPDLKIRADIEFLDPSEADTIPSAVTALTEAKAAGIGLQVNPTLTFTETITVTENGVISAGGSPFCIIEESTIEGPCVIS